MQMNSVGRAKIISSLWELAPVSDVFRLFMYNLFVAQSYAGLGSSESLFSDPFRSETGVQQGGVEAMFIYCLMIPTLLDYP
jgi:hypothetical protein